jgi:hypothetical protein
MSYNTSYNALAKKIIEKDRELRERMEAAHGESGELYKLYKERLDNYTEAEKMPIDDLTRVLFSGMKSDVVLEIALFKLRKDFDEQASQIITRLDNMENDIRTIKDKLNIKQK